MYEVILKVTNIFNGFKDLYTTETPDILNKNFIQKFIKLIITKIFRRWAHLKRLCHTYCTYRYIKNYVHCGIGYQKLNVCNYHFTLIKFASNLQNFFVYIYIV